MGDVCIRQCARMRVVCLFVFFTLGLSVGLQRLVMIRFRVSGKIKLKNPSRKFKKMSNCFLLFLHARVRCKHVTAWMTRHHEH